MSLSDISLTAGMRQNLLSLQNTATLLDRTQTRLSTGKKVNTALDNPTNFFSAQANTQRANDLSTRKDGMSEAVQGVQAANQGITAITALIEAAKGLTQAAQSADVTNRNALAGQFNQVLTQISKQAQDSGYKGKNFLTGDTLNVLFNENGGSSLAINGFNGSATGLGIKNLTIASAVTNAFSGSATGKANVAIHQAVLDTSLGAGVAASTKWLGLTSGHTGNSTKVGGANALGGSGIKSGTAFLFSLSGISGTQSGVFTGGITVNHVYANGVDVTSLFIGKISGWSTTALNKGTFHLSLKNNQQIAGLSNALQAAGHTGATTTGVTISLDVSIAAHTTKGKKLSAPSNVFQLQVGDQSSGLSIIKKSRWNGPAGSAVSGQTHSGLALFVDGVYKSQASGWHVSGSTLSGNARIVFATGIVPPSSTITYAYNTGYLSTNIDSTNGGKVIYGGSIKFSVGAFNGSTMAITGVKLDGKTLTSGQFTVTSTGTIVLAAGVKNTSFISKLTYNLTTNKAGDWNSNTGINNSVDQLNTAIDTLRTQSANLASNLNVVTVRQDFTDGMIAVLQKGADNLTLADMNEEGANMLMLQTRQQLGTTSLKMASDAAQSVLRLF